MEKGLDSEVLVSNIHECMVTSINEYIDTPDEFNNKYNHMHAKVMELQGEINDLKGKLAIKTII